MSHTLSTSKSLIQRCQEGDSQAWERLTTIYEPFLRRQLYAYLRYSEGGDLVQDALLVVYEQLKGFTHNQNKGAFRKWLRQIILNRLREFLKKPGRRCEDADLQRLAEWEDPRSRLSLNWDQQHDEHVMRRVIELVRPRFSQKSWRIFWLLTVDGAKPATIAEGMGMSVGAVWTTKCRVLRELRAEGAEFVE
jgi:RNA polymerase sigma-70 factor (ECF subfamily)